MMRRVQIPTTILVALLVPVALLVFGCSSSSTVRVFQNVSEKCSWASQGKIAFASFGGNGQLYIYSITESGANLFLLTPSDNDQDFADEGGRTPAFSPNGEQIAISSRRGASEGIYIIDAVRGDRDAITAVTSTAGAGADTEPSYYPNGTSLIYTSTRRAGDADIRTIGTDGSGQADVVATAAEETWAVVSPDGTKIAYTSDANGNTDIWVKDLGTAVDDPGTCLTAASPYRDEVPAWSPDGTKIAFHSNRNGDFDVWLMAADGSGQVAVTGDQRSDGFPVFNAAGDRLAITRDREVWTVPAQAWTEWQANADTESTQVTRRF